MSDTALEIKLVYMPTSERTVIVKL